MKAPIAFKESPLDALRATQPYAEPAGFAFRLQGAELTVRPAEAPLDGFCWWLLTRAIKELAIVLGCEAPQELQSFVRDKWTAYAHHTIPHCAGKALQRDALDALGRWMALQSYTTRMTELGSLLRRGIERPFLGLGNAACLARSLYDHRLSGEANSCLYDLLDTCFSY